MDTRSVIAAMTIGELYAVGAGLGFLAVFVTGRRLHRLPSVANTFLLMAHKIVSLAILALLAVSAARASAAAGLAPSDWAAVVTSGVFFVVTMTTGAMVSGPARASKPLCMSHRIAAGLALVASGLALCFLLA
jgi:hypothetical protein